MLGGDQRVLRKKKDQNRRGVFLPKDIFDVRLLFDVGDTRDLPVAPLRLKAAAHAHSRVRQVGAALLEAPPWDSGLGEIGRVLSLGKSCKSSQPFTPH